MPVMSHAIDRFVCVVLFPWINLPLITNIPTGYGDMAVSNSLGSNVFDILLCLGIPWIIECVFKKGKSVTIDSGGLTYSALTLLATVVFLLASMGVNKWKLTKGYGALCLLAYVIVITLSCLFELNIFEDINPPTCPR